MTPEEQVIWDMILQDSADAAADRRAERALEHKLREQGEDR